jgi:hypothetical protein
METARQSYGIGVHCEQILRDFTILRDECCGESSRSSTRRSAG